MGGGGGGEVGGWEVGGLAPAPPHPTPPCKGRSRAPAGKECKEGFEGLRLWAKLGFGFEFKVPLPGRTSVPLS